MVAWNVFASVEFIGHGSIPLLPLIKFHHPTTPCHRQLHCVTFAYGRCTAILARPASLTS